MKLTYGLLALLLAASSAVAKKTEHSSPSQLEKLGHLTQKYAITSVPSIALGVACGVSCAILDEYVPFFINWPIFAGIKSSAAASIKQSLRDSALDFDESVFDSALWVASWISYLKSLTRAPKTEINMNSPEPIKVIIKYN